MKTLKKIILVVIVIIFASCSDVVDVEVQEGPKRLVVEASLDWEKGSEGNVQTIRLRESTPFFSTNTNTEVTGASVVVTNEGSGASYNFEDQGNGEYLTTNFEPVLEQK